MWTGQNLPRVIGLWVIVNMGVHYTSPFLFKMFKILYNKKNIKNLTKDRDFPGGSVGKTLCGFDPWSGN